MAGETLYLSSSAGEGRHAGPSGCRDRDHGRTPARSCASLLAGKLHAIRQRPWPKGRGFYDLVWYLSDPAWPAPNPVLLNAALEQTGRGGSPLTEATWLNAVRERLRSVRWDALAADAGPLLESPEDRALLMSETVTRLLDQRTPPSRRRRGRWTRLRTPRRPARTELLGVTNGPERLPAPRPACHARPAGPGRA